MKVLAVILSSALLLISLPAKVWAVDFSEVTLSPSQILSIKNGRLEKNPTHFLGNINTATSQDLLFFENITIPQNSYLLDATLLLTIKDSSGQNVNSKISLSELPQTDVPSDYKDFLKIKNEFINFERWRQIPKGMDGTTVISPDISSLIQNKIRNDQWKTQNSLLLSLQDDYSSIDSGIEYYSPKLKIKFAKPSVAYTNSLRTSKASDVYPIRIPSPTLSLTPTPTIADKTTTSETSPVERSLIISRVVSQDSSVSNSTFDDKKNIQSLGKDSNGQIQNTFLFDDITIQRGRKVKNAFLTFTISGSSGGIVNVDIATNNDVNPITPTSVNDYELLKDNLSKTHIKWNSIPDGKWGTNITSPNLAPIIQELVDREDWQSGNPILFYFSDNNSSEWSDRTFLTKDFEGTDGKPTLVIEFEDEFVPDTTSDLFPATPLEKDPFDLSTILTPILKE